MLHHAAGIQCIQCSRLFLREDFSKHLPACKETVARISSLHAQQAIAPIRVNVVSAKIEQLSSMSEQLEPSADAAKYVYQL